MCPGLAEPADFFQRPTSPLVFLQPPKLQERTVPNLKDQIHICLEPEVQGYVITLNGTFSGSKYPQITP